jgi:hypothetical protein
VRVCEACAAASAAARAATTTNTEPVSVIASQHCARRERQPQRSDGARPTVGRVAPERCGDDGGERADAEDRTDPRRRKPAIAQPQHEERQERGEHHPDERVQAAQPPVRVVLRLHAGRRWRRSLRARRPAGGRRRRAFDRTCDAFRVPAIVAVTPCCSSATGAREWTAACPHARRRGGAPRRPRGPFERAGEKNLALRPLPAHCSWRQSPSANLVSAPIAPVRRPNASGPPRGTRRRVQLATAAAPIDRPGGQRDSFCTEVTRWISAPFDIVAPRSSTARSSASGPRRRARRWCPTCPPAGSWVGPVDLVQVVIRAV